MKVLSIDTAGRYDFVVLMQDARILAETARDSANNSLRDIIILVDGVLRRAGLALRDVDAFAVGIGPGSWTGVRVGLTVGKTFAFSLDKPVCGVSSLDALAYEARGEGGLVCPLVDAGRGNVYAALYRSVNAGLVKERDYSAGPVEVLVRSIAEPVVFIGEAVEEHRDTITELLGPQVRFLGEGHGRGRAVGSLALDRLIRGQGDDSLALSPLYLRDPLARALGAGEMAES